MSGPVASGCEEGRRRRNLRQGLLSAFYSRHFWFLLLAVKPFRPRPALGRQFTRLALPESACDARALENLVAINEWPLIVCIMVPSLRRILSNAVQAAEESRLKTHETIKALLESTQLEDLKRGLELVRGEIARLGSQEARPLFEMVCSVFYIDPLDHPELMPALDEAVNLVVGFGNWVIPALVERLDAGDLKAELAVSHALGRIGADAIQPLMAEYQRREDVNVRVFVLYALSKIRSPKVLQAVPLALEAAQSEDVELRDTATRTLGKFIESIPPTEVTPEYHEAFIEQLRRNLGDPNAGIRAKAIRSWGKMAKCGHLGPTECDELKWVCQHLLGVDEAFEWDRAYIVRKQAQEALDNLN